MRRLLLPLPEAGRNGCVIVRGGREALNPNHDGRVRFRIDQPGEYALRTGVE